MSRNIPVSHSKIFDYWKGKAITEKGMVIDDDFEDKNSIPVVYDWGEPCCWACGKFIHEVFDIKDYDEIAQLNPKILYDVPKIRSKYNRCHIVPHQAGGSDEPSNLFLMCKECHEESPDTLNPQNFFKWVYKKRKNELRPFGRDMNNFFKKYLEDCEEKGKNPLTYKLDEVKVFTHGTKIAESSLIMAFADTCDDL